jgi:hypothetical protein
MFSLIRKVFPTAAASAPPSADPEVPAGRHGNVPKYLTGYREAMERLKLRPIVIRSTRHRQPQQIEQGPVGLASDRDFQPPAAPLVTPKARGIAALDNGPPPMHQPYSLEPEEQAIIDRKSSGATMWAAPYSLTGRDLSG